MSMSAGFLVMTGSPEEWARVFASCQYWREAQARWFSASRRSRASRSLLGEMKISRGHHANRIPHIAAVPPVFGWQAAVRASALKRFIPHALGAMHGRPGTAGTRPRTGWRLVSRFWLCSWPVRQHALGMSWARHAPAARGWAKPVGNTALYWSSSWAAACAAASAVFTHIPLVTHIARNPRHGLALASIGFFVMRRRSEGSIQTQGLKYFCRTVSKVYFPFA